MMRLLEDVMAHLVNGCCCIYCVYASAETLCAGLVEVEEGELVGKKLSLHTQALARPSFAKEPHVKEVWPQCGLSLTSHKLTHVTLACVGWHYIAAFELSV